LLELNVARQLSKLYTTLPKDQQYINIEPHIPLASATALVEKVLREAEAMVPPIDQALAALAEAGAEKTAQ
jgi:hypothetical protein